VNIYVNRLALAMLHLILAHAAPSTWSFDPLEPAKPILVLERPIVSAALPLGALPSLRIAPY
jgi:hypothetical protein